MPVRAYYFDGKTSRRHLVTLQVAGDVAQIDNEHGERIRHCPLNQLHVSERTHRAARKVTFPDQAYLEILDHAAFATLLQETHHRDSLVVRLQQNWRASIAAAALLVALLAMAYLFLVPAAAKVIANNLPRSVEEQIGDSALEFLDAHIFAASNLSPAQQNAIVTRFAGLTATLPDAPAYEIVFRHSLIGPNALALPSGQIVLTDEIVQLVQDDDAVMGVLAHELGHVAQRDLMRRLIQSSAIAATATLLVGDISAVLVNIPTLLLDLKYSRDVETQADDYAIALFKFNGISERKLADVFAKLEQHEGASKTSDYLSTHPSNAERIQHIMQAQ
ncbi:MULTISPECIES: M48 family metallopeptidase [unclassified Herbaspirillum]|uniref:M48 family metallopeptidase n=1 Tax=unclassified Herbaspirillum TaxID=2624150 RepID=UPI00160F7F15|nr:MULTISPECIES: M48 family metallopeptidase [unclassified Herbaspirillum]